MDRELLRAQCEAYVLGALEGDERAEIQALINRGDQECLAMLRETNELVSEIALAAPLVDPPALLRTRLLNSLPKAAHSAPPRRNWFVVAGWAVAAGLAVVAVVVQSNARRAENELAQARSEIERMAQEAQQNRQVLSILMAPDARMIRLSTTSPDTPQLRAFWSQATGLVLAGMNIPTPAAGRTMQLWVVPKKGNPISAGIFQPAANGQVLMIAIPSANPQDASALAISDEPAGGSPQPTTTPAWVGALGE